MEPISEKERRLAQQALQLHLHLTLCQRQRPVMLVSCESAHPERIVFSLDEPGLDWLSDATARERPPAILRADWHAKIATDPRCLAPIGLLAVDKRRALHTTDWIQVFGRGPEAVFQLEQTMEIAEEEYRFITGAYRPGGRMCSTEEA